MSFSLLKMIYLLSCIFITATLAQTQETPFRLPTTILPTNYILELKPVYNIESITSFTGDVSIEIDITDDYFSDVTNDDFTVLFNRDPDMSITSSQLIRNNGESTYDISDTSFNTTTEIQTDVYGITNVELQGYINDGDTFVLRMGFSGKIYGDDHLTGIYRTGINLATQFQATSARRAFPCFDEPKFKATFDLTLIAPAKATVLSNMQGNALGDESNSCLWSGQEGNNCSRVEFAQTPVMSTYLIGFVIGEYNFVDSDDIETASNVPQRVYYPPSLEEANAQFGLDNSVKTLNFFEEQFGITYLSSGMDKLYSVGVQEFAAGAMENWGICIYRTTRLIINAQNSSVTDRATSLVTIAHENAHQWFGNLVSPDWWDDLWLNEGFATYMAYIGGNAIGAGFPVNQLRLAALSNVEFADSSVFTHAVKTEITGDPSTILAQFDSITYQKGMGVIATIANYMGAESFNEGITEFLTEFSFSTATSDDLAEVLDAEFAQEHANGTLISLMMNQYILTEGLPLLYVDFEENTDEGGYDITLTQQRMTKFGEMFYESGADDIEFVTQEMVDDFDAQFWYVPIKIAASQGDPIEFDALNDNLMRQHEFTGRIDPVINNGVEFYLLNNNFRNYFRVYYDDFSLKLITDNFVHPNIGTSNHYQIISDRYALMVSQYITPQEYLDFLRKVSPKLLSSVNLNPFPESQVWGLIIESLLTIDDMFCDLAMNLDDISTAQEENNIKVRGYFRIFATDLLNDVLNKIMAVKSVNNGKNDANWPFLAVLPANDDIRTLLGSVLSALIRLEHYNTRLRAFEKFYIHDVDPDTDLPYMNEDGLIITMMPDLIQAAVEGLLAFDRDNDDSYDKAIEIYQLSPTIQKTYILRAFGALYGKSNLVEKALEFINSDVDPNLKMTGFTSMKQCLARFQMYKFLTRNDGEIFEELFSEGSGSVAWQEPLTALVNTFANEHSYENITAFFVGENRVNEGTERIVQQSRENVYARSMWVDEYNNAFQEYLRVYVVERDEKDQPLWEIILVAVVCCVGLGLLVFAFWLPSRPSTHDRIMHHMMSSKRYRKRTLDEYKRKTSQQGIGGAIAAGGHSLDRTLPTDPKNTLPRSDKVQQLSDDVTLAVENTNKKDAAKKTAQSGSGYGATSGFDYQRLKDDDADQS